MGCLFKKAPSGAKKSPGPEKNMGPDKKMGASKKNSAPPLRGFNLSFYG
jgi:hypothetical protein